MAYVLGNDPGGPAHEQGDATIQNDTGLAPIPDEPEAPTRRPDPVRPHALPVIDVDTLVLTTQAYDVATWRLPMAAVATAVDLRPRRARRTPNPLSFGRAVHLARVDTGTQRSFFDQATIALIFRVPRRVPAGPWDDDPTCPDDERVTAWDAVVIAAGRQTDHILATLARRGVPRSPTIAAGVLAASRKARGADNLGGGLRMGGADHEQRLILASMCLVVATLLTMGLVIASGSPTWLLILVFALPAYLATASQGGVRPPPRRLPQRL